MSKYENVGLELTNQANDIVKKYNIRSDRDLVKKLKLTEEQKDMMFAWIKYQGLYEYRNGFDDGQEHIRDKFKELMMIRESSDNINTIF